jgi:hypothetical protein
LDDKAGIVEELDYFGVLWIGQIRMVLAKLLTKNADVSIQIPPRTCSPLGKQVFQDFLFCSKAYAKAGKKNIGKNTGSLKGILTVEGLRG